MRYLILAALFLGGCAHDDSATDEKVSELATLTYSKVGGKTDALVETLSIECATNTVTRERTKQTGEEVSSVSTQVKGVCHSINTSELCLSDKLTQQGADFTTYRLTCEFNSGERSELSVIGPFASLAPQGLVVFSQYAADMVNQNDLTLN